MKTDYIAKPKADWNIYPHPTDKDKRVVIIDIDREEGKKLKKFRSRGESGELDIRLGN